jgi:glucose/arabinose dehydrogenase
MLRRAHVWCALVLAITCASPAAASAAPLQLESVGTFAEPMFVTAPRTDTSRFFVVERQGAIQVVENGVKRKFLDLTNDVFCCGGERGMASMAFAPDYATSGLFYVQYTAKNPEGAVTVAEYRRSATDPNAADPGSRRIVLSIPHERDPDHNGGQLQFGPDGALYISVGDAGGTGGDPAGNGQNLTSRDPAVVNGFNHDPLLGKILRIDPRGGPPYAVPQSNPFPAPAREVYAYGLRNPWRFSFDRTTGDLIIADVGQNLYEEVDFAASPDRGRGANFGWNVYEALHTYPGGALVSPPFPAGFAFPLIERWHSRDSVCSITGGYVVRDPQLPELAGQYLYGDYCNPALRAVTLTGSGAQNDHAIGLNASFITSFGEDACARVYVVTNGGAVSRITNGTSTCTTPVPPFPAAPSVSVSDVSTAEGDSGTTPAGFVVSLSSASSSTVTVRHATADGTAAAGADYTSTSGDLTFTPGQTSKTVEVPVHGDATDEDDETFSVDLSSPTNATIGDGHGVGTILDDDPAPSISIAGGSVAEGDTGTATLNFTATLDAASEKQVTVGFATANGSATQPEDYTSTTGTLTFAPGQTSKRIDVPVVGDTRREGNETVAVDLSNPSNATLGTAHALGTIVDDDAQPAISLADASVTEGNSGTAELKLIASLSAPSGIPVSVHYATADGTATAPADYTSASGDLTFAPGDTSKTITVTVKGDALDELDETLAVHLSSPVEATIADADAVGTILDDDPTPALSVTGGTVSEGDTGSRPLTFTVALSAASGRSVTVNYSTADGTAQAPADYTAATGTLTFTPGQTSRTVDVSVIGDTLDESNETFTLVLAAPTGATLQNGVATGTITDDDALPSVSVNDASVVESGSAALVSSAAATLTRAGAELVFTVELPAESALPVTVHYATADGTAKAPADYQATSGDLTFTPGQTIKTVAVPVNDDAIDENDETIELVLSAPVNAALGRSRATGTILDDDAPPALSIADTRVAEGATASFAVSLTAPSEKTISVAYATADGSAVAPGDYQARSGTLTLTPGQSTVNVDVASADDAVDEDDQTFLVRLGTPVGATILRGEATGTITDDDAPPVVSIADASVDEGDDGTTPMQFVVSLSAPSEKVVTVHFATSDGSATGGSDYTPGTGEVAFAPGETRRAVAVGVDADKAPELDESLTLGDHSSGAKGTGTIVDDDPAATALRAAKSARLNSVFCRSSRRDTCPGVSVPAVYGSAGTGTWTFESRDGKRRVQLAKTKVTRRAAGRARTTFRFLPGTRSAALRRRVLAQRNPILYATLSFKAESGKRATVQWRVRLLR